MDVGPLTLTVVVLAGLAVRQGWVAARRPSGDRTWSVVALVTVLLLAGTGGWFEWRHQWVQAVTGTALRELTGREDAEVSCQRLSGDLLDVRASSGYVSWDQDGTVQLRRTVCHDLAGWLMGSRAHPTSEQITALHVLTHEAMHVAGERNESAAECYAIQHDAEMAELLGASDELGQGMARAYYQGIYPSMRGDYRSADCSADGALDLTPGDGTFP